MSLIISVYSATVVDSLKLPHSAFNLYDTESSYCLFFHLINDGVRYCGAVPVLPN